MQSSSSSDRAVSRNRVVSSRTIEPGETSVKTTRITSSRTENNEPVVRTRVVTSQVSSSRGFESGDPLVQTRFVEMSEPTVRTRVITSEESSGEPVIRTTRVVTSKSESSSDPVVRTRVVTTRGESNPPPVVRTRVITSRGESGAGDTVVQTRVTSTHKELSEPATRTTRVLELGEPGVTRTTTRVVESGEPVTRTTTRVVESSEPVTRTTTRTVDLGEPMKRSGESHSVHTTRVVKKVSAVNGGNKTFTETTVTSSKGASPQVRTVTRTSTKLVGTPSKKSKISDIITGMEDESLTAREALLKWAQRTTERYPGIKITDFTKSWKDGLAFNAILHRNKPDLLDYRSLKARNAKENLELAFSLAEKEFGITRLLDPEDVDTPEADEKSLITYISSIYDVFPEPSTYHPFADDYEKNRKIEDYKELATSFQLWMENSLKLFGDEKTSKTLIDMKSLLLESSKFRSEELPKRLREKQRLTHLYRDIQKSSRHSSHLNIQKDLQIEELEKTWNKITVALQERDQKIRDEICRLEKLQRLAEKINRDLKICDGKLEDVDKRISEEEKRVRLHQVDIKHNFDQLEGELRSVDDLLKVLNKDILSLEEKGFKQISEIKTRFEVSKNYYDRLKMSFESGLVLVQSSEKITSLEQKVTKNRNATYEKQAEINDRQSISLKEHFDWIEKKHKRIDSIEFGNDYQTSKANLELLKVEQKSIEQYKKKTEILASQKNIKECEDLPESEDFEKLQNKFKVLLSSTIKKQQDMENFMDFIQSASRELKWMNDKEELEIGRDWSSKNLNINELEKHQETLTSDLEKHEIQFNAVQSRGESLLLQKHPASKIVEGYLKNMQNKWSWLLQLTFCLEIHLRHAQQYQKFFRETRESEQWMKKVEEKLNVTFNKAVFSIDEGEQYLKQMEKLKDDISKHSEIITSLLRQCNQVVPLKQRRTQIFKLLPVTTICNYTFSDGVISKDEKCLVKEIAPKMWKVQTSNGMEATVPSVCFVIPPPNPEAIEHANSLKKRYDDLLILWAQRQRKLRQNLILATIKVVKTWDISHFRKMDATQRDSIIRALNSDVQKLTVEGTEFSEPALVKLKEEMEQCNIAFEALTNQMSDNETEKSPKSAGRKLTDSMLGMQSTLNEKEKLLRNKLSAQVTWDLDSLENLVIEHKDFDNALSVLEDQIAEMIQSFKNTHKKTTALQMKHDTLVQTWEKVSKLSHLYIEKLKLVDVTLNQLSEVTQAISNIEVKLASCDNMSSDLKDLEKSHDNLLSFQEDMQYSQKNIDDAQESSRKLKEVMKKIRSKQDNFADLNKFDNDLKKLVARLENAKIQIIERLRSCGASSELLRSYKNKVEKDNIWISETTVKLNSLKTIKKMTTKEIELTVEPAMNMYSTIYERKSSFEDINTLGARYIREAKLAVEENYKVCEDNTSQLELWLSDIENKLADLGVIQENLPGLQLQINTAQILKKELESKQNLITTCLDQMRNLAQRGLEVLNKEEIDYLQKKLISLRRHYDLLLNESDRLLKRLINAFEELRKFKSEVQSFKQWMNEAKQDLKKVVSYFDNLGLLESKSEHIRSFTNDVIAHQADLRFLTMAGQKFIDESQDYLKALNAFRSNLTIKLPALKARDSEIKSEVQEVTTLFHNFLNEVNKLSDSYATICSKYRSYSEVLDKAKSWISEIRKSATKVISEPVADEPLAIQEQLDKLKLINMEVVGQSRIVENVTQAVKILIDTLDYYKVAVSEMKNIENNQNVIVKDYSELINHIGNRIKELQISLIQSQDIKTAVDRILKWLEETESTVKLHEKPVSLLIDKLEAEVLEYKILKSDVENQKQSIGLLESTTKEISSDSNPKLARKVDSKLKDVSERYDKIAERISRRWKHLEEVSENVHSFQEKISKFEEWCTGALQRIESLDNVHPNDVDGFSSIIDYVLSDCNSKKEDFDRIHQIGKDLSVKKDVCDIKSIKDYIHRLEQQWKHLDEALNEKKQLGRARFEQINMYDALRANVHDCLLKIELELEKLEPVAVDHQILKSQTAEIMHYLKEHSEYSSTIKKLNSIGNACDTVLRDGSKGKTSSPIRKLPSPTKKSPSVQASGQSPLSTVSSGFSSRQSSVDNIGGLAGDLSLIQQQLSEINDRYNLLGKKISDRNQEINETTEGIKSLHCTLKCLLTYVDEKQNKLPKESISLSKGVIDKHLKNLKDIEKEMLEKQPEVYNLKKNALNILSKRKEAKGSAELQKEFNNFEEKWTSLLTSTKQNILFLQDIREFQELQILMTNWLNQKEKMFHVLGPIASEPRMVSSQVQQVQVMRDEFTTQKSFMERMIFLSTSIIDFSKNSSPSDGKIEKQIESIQHKWNDMYGKLVEREKNLETASGVAKDFHKNLTELQGKLQEMSDQFEALEEKGYNTETFRKKLMEMEDGLDNLRPLLSDACSVSEQLCDVLCDSSSKSEIKYKISLLEKSYATLRKKIDNKKAEVESSLKEDKVFFKCCEDIELWLNVKQALFTKSEPMSANSVIMLKKIEEYERLYTEIMNKEHEIYLCLSKGSDMLMKLPGKQQSAIKTKLESIKKQYETIKKNAIAKHTSLRSCLENGKKYQTALDTFVPWLKNAEEKCIAIKPLILKREVVNKSLKEVEVLRSELLSVRYPEFQNIQQLGEIIISSCELDRESTKKDLGTLKKKWKDLNNDISMKVQSLEELSQVLLEFEEIFRDVKHKVERLEDKMCSHEALGNVPCDALFLDRLKVLLEETNNMKSEINKLKKHSKLVIEKAGPDTDTSEIIKHIKDIESRHLSLSKKVEDRCTSFSASYKVVSVFMDEVRSLRTELSNFDESFHQMQPIARDLKTLKEQLRDIKKLKLDLLKTKKKYSPEKMTESITQEIYIAETKNYVEQVNSLTRQISRLEEHIIERETIIESMTTRIENFYNIYSETDKTVKSLTKKVDTCEVVVGDVDTIRSKQKNFKEFHSSEVIPLSKHIVEVNKIGYGLVQSATNKVDTSDLEEKIEALNCNWNNLQEMINEKEKKLDIALLQSGKLQEALSGVERWLIDTEEMVSNQKPPSFEFKVCKAQVQEQKFLKKMLLDRQNSVMSLKTMETDLISKTKTTETEQTETLLKSITSRFGGLISTAENRMLVLEKTIPIAQEYESISAPLTEWIETVEKRLVTMTSIPIEESQIKKVISEHKKISKDITFHQQTVDQLNAISENLKTITVDTDSDTLHHKISCFNEKFEDIKASSDNVGTLLKEAETGIGSFSASYKNSVSFIEETTRQLTHFDSLSVHFEKLQNQHKQLKVLNENMNQETTKIEKVIASGENIMKFVSGEDSIVMKEKLDTLKAKRTEVSRKLNERLVTAETSLSLVESFYSTLNKLISELDSSENTLKTLDKDSLDVQRNTIKKLGESISEFRCLLDVVNQNGSRLCQMSTGEGSLVIENQMTRVNQRFETISEQVQRKDERIQLILQRKYDIVSDMEELSDWFEEVGRKVSEAEGLSSEPSSLNMLLKEQKSVCEELNVQKNRVRDVITTAKKLMRESSSEDLTLIHEKIEDLKTRSNNVSTICQEKLSILEQALPLSQHFYDTHSDLGQWLDEVENQVELLEAPALNSAKIKKQQDRNKDLTESVQERKPLVDKLNKTGSALTKLCHEDYASEVEVILESDNSRYNALRKILREHQDALEEALQATSQFSDKLEGILNALTSTADQLHNAEPISAHPDRIQEQINDNRAVLQDLDKRTITLEAVKKAAGDVITKASTIDEPAVKDIQTKLNRLNDLYATIEKAAHNRGKSLEEALVAAERFWHELTAVMKALKELQGNLKCQEPPAVEPAAVQQQQEVLQEIKQEITQTKPEVDHCRKAGKNLMELCGEPDKPDVQKHIEDLDSVWENVTTLYAKREQNLVDAMEKAMVFHETLQNLLEFLDTFEEKFSTLGPVSTDIDSVKKQISQLKNFKMEVDPHMIEVEALNRQAQELLKSTSSDQATSIREPLMDINKRWNELLKSIVERQREMENTLLKLGQFQHALEEQLVWISKTEKTLDDLKPILGDPQVLEIVLAKHKVISNDIQAHQSSIDMINRAGHEFVDSDQGSEDAKSTQHKLQNLLTKWKQLQSKSSDRYQELEEALKEAQKFHQEIQDLLMWLNELDGHLVTSKPVGGLPETAQEQLNKFMDLYSELDMNRYKVEDVLQQGQIYQKKAGENTTKALEHNLRNLKQKWDAILNKASDRKIKLEIALREATEFNETLQQFVEWLTKAEKYIVGIKPVSRLMKIVLEQIEEHRNFQKEVGANRELMLNLDKKGTHLKYFSQKQDVILIKNLLQSVQHRWERIVSKAADRTRSLDHGYKESKEFHDAYASFSAWLDETEKVLDTEAPIGNDPIKIKRLLSKHKEFQRSLGSKQITFDAVTKTGRTLKDRCPKQDVPSLTQMLEELNMRWNKICVRSVNRQRQLEEALLHSGQFKDAVLVLMEWIDISIKKLSDSKPYHGDLDTVTRLLDEHKGFEEELKNRGNSLESVRKTAIELKKQASETDVESINLQIKELNTKWEKICDLSETRRKLLLQALEQAEKLYKMVHVLLEWLADAEVKLRFFGSLPEDDESTKQEIAEHTKFLAEMEEKESLKNSTLELAENILQKCHPDGITVVRHWITIIKARWDEISTWAKQCGQRLHNHLQSLKDISDLLENLLLWLLDAESTLLAQEKETLPDDITVLDNLIKEHQVFMNNMSKKQIDVDKVSKAFSKHQKNKGVVKDKDKAKEKFPRSGPTGPQKTSTPSRAEIDKYIKHPRAKLLLEKWWTVWILAMERQRRLQDRGQYLIEVDKIKHFDFDDWRTRYLGWLNNKKSRIMDQFKKIDKNNVGKVTKQEFIDGILKSKFVTNRLEMERVVDIFDRNGDGFIDSKEYIEVLRPEREGKPKTEDEKIQDEVQRQVAKCTCVHRFKVFQVGEGKYRFGESQKLRLVRILRSTVMVRVGGGWVALDEFLVKNDPCRAKGRTNLELREQFILADGVSQSMTPFKPKASPNSSVPFQSGSTNSIPSAGPITKIREKSERSTPMRQSRSSAENSSDISDLSYSETDSFSNRSGLLRTPTSSRHGLKNVNCKPSSRPSSRQGSRPASRAPSDLSQDGVEEFKNKRKPVTSENNKNAKTLDAFSSGKSNKTQPETSKIPSAKKTLKQQKDIEAPK